MRMLSYTVLTGFLAIFQACGVQDAINRAADAEEHKSKSEDQKADVPVCTFGPGENRSRMAFDGTIKSLRYDAGAHAIVAQLSYSGWDDKQTIGLEMGACALSYPMQCGAKLFLNATPATKPDKILEDEQSFPLEDNFDMANVTITGKDGIAKSVFVDRSGKSISEGLFAGDVKSVSYDAAKNELVIEIGFAGACRAHEFSLEFAPACEKADEMAKQPVCEAKLIHKLGADDPCEGYISKTLRYSLQGVAKNKDYKLVINSQKTKRQVLIP